VGARHFFYWTYGPTASSTENYWSDLRGAHEGVAAMTRQLAAAEDVIAPGKIRPTRLALLYSISSDLWQPFGYVHMLERRGTYLSLVHDQYLVDLLTEEDVEAGRLADYDVFYATDPCIKEAAAGKIREWVRAGGHLHGSTAAGSRNEFNEEVEGLAPVFGIGAGATVKVQPGRYHIRGALNGMSYLDEAEVKRPGLEEQTVRLGAIGVQVSAKVTTGTTAGTFRDGKAAAVHQAFGKGQAFWVGTCPGIAYIKEARFVARELKEQWPEPHRRLINGVARGRGIGPLVELSSPVVEAGVYDAGAGTALVLANFTYQPVADLKVRLFLPRPVKQVRSCEQGELSFKQERAGEGKHPPGFSHAVTFSMKLGLNDIVLLR
jgi:hypothetical protein